MPPARPMRLVGWLLRANRLLGPDREMRSGRRFAEAFRRDGDRPLAPSHVTRWESGQLIANHATLRRYEKLLELPPESLVTLSDTVARAAGTSTAAHLEQPPVADRRRDLYELIDRTQSPGAMSGRDWSWLTEIVATEPSLVLYPPWLWRQLADLLLQELSLATYAAWLQRQEAMSRLLEHSEAGPHAVAACIALADDPDTPVVIEPMTLLDVTADPRANRYLLNQILAPHDARILDAALIAVVHKLRRGHFRDDETALLTRAVRERLADNDSPPSAALHELTRHLLPPPRSNSPGPPGHRSSVGHHLAATAATTQHGDSGRPDDVLADLIDEALFAADPDQRMFASMLIGATPWRDTVAATVVHAFTADLLRRGTTYPLSTLRTLTNLNTAAHRPLVEDILIRPGLPAPLRHAAAWATPHCPGTTPPDVWRRILDTQFSLWHRDPSSHNESTLQGIAYGIGTDGHQLMLTEIASGTHLPPVARKTASWLLNTPEPPA